MRDRLEPRYSKARFALTLYALGAVATLAIAIADGAQWESWPQILAISLGWPVMLLMLMIFVLASLGAPY